MFHLNKAIQEGDNSDLTDERLTASFDTSLMAEQLYGSRQYAKQRREITESVKKLTELHDSAPFPFMNRQEKIDEVSRKLIVMSRHMKNLIDTQNAQELLHLNNEVLGIEGSPLTLHEGMFIPALAGQADDEQQKQWLTRALNREIIGTYAQTEMGHGTNLRRLETTATFDKSAQEFVLQTPTITALKWWPGNLGKSSNYAVVIAILVIDAISYGPHSFLVQLRDENTHKPLEGITIGDIGPKLSFNITDNGFLGFDSYRIPRTNMLMRHSKVKEDGTYVKPFHKKIGYSAMVHVRNAMITRQASYLATALIIATRYSCIRRQGIIDPINPEVKIVDYQTQQYRLFPHIARSYAINFAGLEANKLYDDVLNGIKKGNTSLMNDFHALTSGLKSVVTHMVGQGIEQARLSCGGHGYSQASYISEIYGVAVGGCTYEGENMVMLLQQAKHLIKSVENVIERKPNRLGPLVAYLGQKSESTSLINQVPNAGYSEYVKTFQHVARTQIFSVAERFSNLLEDGIPNEMAWNKCAVELTRASRLHTRLFIVESFICRVNAVVDQKVKKALTDLLHLHLNYELLDVATYALQNEFLSKSQLEHVREQLYHYLEIVRPNAVSFCDSWEISDIELRSVLGRRDGHVYKNLFDWAKQSPLNNSHVLPSFDKFLKPMMEEAKAHSKL